MVANSLSSPVMDDDGFDDGAAVDDADNNVIEDVDGGWSWA